MRDHSLLCFLALLLLALSSVNGDNPYRLYNWTVTYGNIYPLGIKQQGILINGMFPGPTIDCVTNDNLVITVNNHLPEPFLLTWNGLQQRRNSWQDGVTGTNCPILPGRSFTYMIQAKDQIGSYFYFPSLGLHKAAGGYGSLKIYSRPQIPVPFLNPFGDIPVLAGDWFKTSHTKLRQSLDYGNALGFPDGLIINGRGSGNTFRVKQGQTYRFRISNVGIKTSINFRIEGHAMKLVEIEGSHTVQNHYNSLDVHVGQSYSVLVTANQPPKDYYIVVSSRFTYKVLTGTAVLHYENSNTKVSGPLPGGPTTDITWSLNQARTIRWDMKASGPRPNPQGSYHYWKIPISKSIVLANSGARINGKQRYAVNGVSYVSPDTPLKLLDYFNIGNEFSSSTIPDSPPKWGMSYLKTSVMQAKYRSFMEIVFQNQENTVQSWHIDGYSFFVAGMGFRQQWSTKSRPTYNLRDAVARSTVQVYPYSWTAIFISLDNAGMWNIRSQDWARQYLGQQFYLRVPPGSGSPRDELTIPTRFPRCGRALGRH